MSKRTRSRAYQIWISVHNKDGYRVIMNWVDSNTFEWLVAQDMVDGLPYHLFYIRFKGPRDVQTIYKIFDDIKVEPTTKSFKQIKALYSMKVKAELSGSKKSAMPEWNGWQSAILRYIDTQSAMGTIVWVHIGYKNKEFMDLIRHVAVLDSVLVTNQSNEVIVDMIKQQIIVDNKQKNALVMNLPQSTELTSRLFEFLEQIRMGLISDVHKHYVFNPLNIIVFSEKMPDLLTRKQYQINPMSINSIYELE